MRAGGELIMRGNIAVNTSPPHGLLGVQSGGALELVDDVAVSGQREVGVVAELARDADDAAASWSRRLAEEWCSAYGVVWAIEASARARLNARRRHEAYAATVHGSPS